MKLLQAVLADRTIEQTIAAASFAIETCLEGGKRVFICGNGGSAADAQHAAAELAGRFLRDRPALDVEALGTNFSTTTAIANDYDFDEIFSRPLSAKGRACDILIAISTSGNSRNVIRALEMARTKEMLTIGLTGASGGKMAKRSLCDHLIRVPSNETPRIQEMHILIFHAVCRALENRLFPVKTPQK